MGPFSPLFMPNSETGGGAGVDLSCPTVKRVEGGRRLSCPTVKRVIHTQGGYTVHILYIHTQGG